MSDAIQGMLHDGPAQKAPPKVVDTMVVKRVPGKGHHVTHHHTSSAHPAEAHMVPAPGGNTGNLENLHDHMEDHMGSPNPGEQACEDGNCE
jgi:hypothetical protein